jgi:hypothetical protein
MGFGLGGFAAIAGISGLVGAAGSAAAARQQQEAIKATAKAQQELIRAETTAGLANLAADSVAQQSVIRTDALARIQASIYEADTERQNVEFAGIQSRDALLRGGLDTFSFRREASVAQGRLRASAASSGVDINSGSAALLQEEMAVATDLDALSIRQNAQREAYGYDVEGYGAGRRRSLAEMEAASTAKVANANIQGIRDVSAIRAKGIKDVAKQNIKGIGDAAKKGGGFSPAGAAALSLAGSATNFASAWYMSGR